MREAQRGRRGAPRRGDLEPGQPVRRLYGHAARGLRALPARHRGARRSSRRTQLWIGGDHLGPNAWRGEPADAAMAKAARAGARVRRGGLSQDSPRLLDGLRRRSRALARGDRRRARREPRARSRKRAWREAGGEAPVYVIGTEVPTPGGATEELASSRSRRRRRPRRRSMRIARRSPRAGLEEAWPRVLALVVQPGVEFDHHKVIDYRPRRGAKRSATSSAGSRSSSSKRTRPTTSRRTA